MHFFYLYKQTTKPPHVPAPRLEAEKPHQSGEEFQALLVVWAYQEKPFFEEGSFLFRA